MACVCWLILPLSSGFGRAVPSLLKFIFLFNRFFKKSEIPLPKKVRVPPMRKVLQSVRQSSTALAIRLRGPAASVRVHFVLSTVSAPVESPRSRRPEQLPASHSRQHLKILLLQIAPLSIFFFFSRALFISIFLSFVSQLITRERNDDDDDTKLMMIFRALLLSLSLYYYYYYYE